MALTTTVVGTASTQVVAANPVVGATTPQSARRKLTFINPNIAGQQNIWLVQAPTAAVADNGIPLSPGEKFDVFGDQCLTAWNAIGSAALAKVSVIEYLYGASAIPQNYNINLSAG
jgi:hypothetical protein